MSERNKINSLFPFPKKGRWQIFFLEPELCWMLMTFERQPKPDTSGLGFFSPGGIKQPPPWEAAFLAAAHCAGLAPSSKAAGAVQPPRSSGQSSRGAGGCQAGPSTHRLPAAQHQHRGEGAACILRCLCGSRDYKSLFSIIILTCLPTPSSRISLSRKAMGRAHSPDCSHGEPVCCCSGSDAGQ